MRIIIADDDLKRSKSLTNYLELKGIVCDLDVVSVGSINDAKNLMQNQYFDV